MARLAPLRRLRWKLTLSYTLVTVATLLALEVVLVVVLGAVVWNSELLPQTTSNLLSGVATEQVAPLVADDAPDLEALDAWLAQVQDLGLEHRQGTATTVLEARGFRSGAGELWILDPAGTMLGRMGQAGPPPELHQADFSHMPGVEQLMERARSGERNPALLYTRPSSSEVTAVAPVLGPDGQLRALLLLHMRFTLGSLPFGDLLGLLGISLVLFLIGSAVVGMLFGYLTARGLTRRLGAVAQAAQAWGGGDFKPTIQDRSLDELGQLSRQLNGMAAQLEELIGTREELSAAEERNRLARDLHDSVKQQVFAISMNLGAARELLGQRPDAASERIDAAFELARQAQQELTSILQTLRPAQLQGKGLRSALDGLVTEWQAQASIPAAFEAHGGAALSHKVEEALFRVAQEALANVARHSQATAVSITLRVEQGTAALEVRDNGRGFVRRENGGMGLRSMEERITALGGELTLESGSAGTSVLAQVPLGRVWHKETEDG